MKTVLLWGSQPAFYESLIVGRFLSVIDNDYLNFAGSAFQLRGKKDPAWSLESDRWFLRLRFDPDPPTRHTLGLHLPVSRDSGR